jgi:hypothetical protein
MLMIFNFSGGINYEIGLNNRIVIYTSMMDIYTSLDEKTRYRIRKI